MTHGNYSTYEYHLEGKVLKAYLISKLGTRRWQTFSSGAGFTTSVGLADSRRGAKKLAARDSHPGTYRDARG